MGSQTCRIESSRDKVFGQEILQVAPGSGWNPGEILQATNMLGLQAHTVKEAAVVRNVFVGVAHERTQASRLKSPNVR
jgi:hypothetical protein